MSNSDNSSDEHIDEGDVKESIDHPKTEDGRLYFKNLKEFKNFYNENRDEIDNKSTYALNKAYKIKDLIIRKNYGVLNYRKENIYTPGDGPKRHKNESRIQVLEDTVNEMILVVNDLQEKMKKKFKN